MNSVKSAHVPDATGQAPKQMSYVPDLKLNNGQRIPMIAYGMGTANSGSKNPELVSYCETAIKCGYFHIDTAESYRNEAETGQALQNSKIAREKLYITAKCTPKLNKPIEESFAVTLKSLKTDYVDLYLIHSPFYADGNPKELQEKWAQMEVILESGRAKTIGVSNFLQSHLEIILETAKITPAVNQIEYHPYLQHENLLPFCRSKEIAVESYAGLTPVTKAAPGPVDAALAAAAKKYGVSESDVAQRWVLDQGVILVTTSSKEERLRSMISKLPSFKLTPREAQEISDEGHKKHFRGFWADKFAPDDRS